MAVAALALVGCGGSDSTVNPALEFECADGSTLEVRVVDEGPPEIVEWRLGDGGWQRGETDSEAYSDVFWGRCQAAELDAGGDVGCDSARIYAFDDAWYVELTETGEDIFGPGTEAEAIDALEAHCES